jgi:NAD+ kinase
VDLALVVNPDKPSTLQALVRAQHWLHGSPHRLRLWSGSIEALRARPDLHGELHGIELLADVREADVVIALGGDGTLLHAVRLLQGAPLPLLGINLGSLGFLTDTPEDQFEAALAAVVAGRYRLDPRMLLEAVYEPRRGAPVVMTGLNDVVLHGPRARVLDVSMRVAGADLGRTLADGVIVATPSGSTAYSLSAGGPVLSPRLHALVVTPISPHTLSLRPLVVGADEEIELRLHRSASGYAELSVDGQATCDVGAGEQVRVRRAPRDLQLVVTRERTFYDTLRTKLAWGHRGRSGDSDQ